MNGNSYGKPYGKCHGKKYGKRIDGKIAPAQKYLLKSLDTLQSVDLKIFGCVAKSTQVSNASEVGR